VIEMKITIAKASDFKDLISLVSKSIDELPISIGDDGLSIKTLSADKTTMVILAIPPDQFDELELEQAVKMIVRSQDLAKVLKRASRGDSLELSIEKDELSVVFKNEKQAVKRSFSIPIVSREVEEVGEPKVELPVEASAPSRDLRDIVEDVRRVGGEMKIEYEKGDLKISSESPGRSYIAVLKENAPLLSLKSSVDKASSKYSVDLIYSVVKGIPSEGILTLAFGEQLPLKLTVDIEAKGKLIYWVAPTA
jgi:proliferating cell nuclear antigen